MSPVPAFTPDWAELAVDQLDRHWTDQLRPRLDGLTDEEWAWEPVPGCWSVRPRGAPAAGTSWGAGDWMLDYEPDVAEPAPLTTIAWRMAHLTVGCFGARAADQFGAGGVDYPSFDYAGTATGALAQLDSAYGRWTTGVRGLGRALLLTPVRADTALPPGRSTAELVLHINREAVHHGAEIALLRDLYRARAG